MALIKVCGIKTQEEIDILNKYKPDFAGFVFSESKRRISLEKAALLNNRLSKDIKAVGVFVNEQLSYVREACKSCSLKVIQLHGDENSSYIEELKAELGGDILIWKAIRVKKGTLFSSIDKANIDAILLDAFSKNAYGGTGETFNWDTAVDFARNNKIVLAGGLSRGNVLSAIELLNPYCVDVSSGVEIDGYKSEFKVRDFITQVKRRANV